MRVHVLFIWPVRRESNPRQSGSKPDTLSTELRTALQDNTRIDGVFRGKPQLILSFLLMFGMRRKTDPGAAFYGFLTHLLTLKQNLDIAALDDP